MIARYALLASRIRQDADELERVERLATRLRPTYGAVQTELSAFAAWLDGLARES